MTVEYAKLDLDGHGIMNRKHLEWYKKPIQRNLLLELII